MPDRSDKVEQLYEETDEYELPYISKSRVKTWLENPEHFRLKYLEEIKEPETEAMVRGTRIHESFEDYYEEIRDEYADRDRLTRLTLDESIARLPDERKKWADFIEPYISNFLLWEIERFSEIDDVLDFRPVSIEEEHWRDPIMGIDGEPEWMGLADVILPAASLHEVDADDGVVIVDFKTGKVPDKKYRSPGIYTELEYYTLLFEDKYDVVGSGAYYPKENEFLVQPDDPEYREDVLNAAENMVIASREYDGSQQFEAKEGPLCKWGLGDDEESAFYGVCSQCTWGVPANNKHQFEQLAAEGYNDYEIAEHLDTSANAVRYWKHKLNLT